MKVELDDHRQGDADGRLKPTLDVLKEAGVIIDDRKKYVKGAYIGWARVEGCVVSIEECDPWTPLVKAAEKVVKKLESDHERIDPDRADH